MISYIRKYAVPLGWIVCVLFFFFCAAGSASRQAQQIEELKKRDPALLTEEEKLTLHLAEEFDKAERYISRGLFPEALAIVQSIINDHSNSLHSDKAYFIKGSIYASMLNFERDLEKARAAFRMVLASGPESEFDERAREALERIKK